MQDGFLQGALDDVRVQRRPGLLEEEGQPSPMLQAVTNRLAQTRVGLHLLFRELGVEPSVQLFHDRPAVLLVKVQPRLRRQCLFFRLRIVPIDRGEAFQHVTALLGKARHHLDVAAPSVRITMSHEDLERLRQLGQVARQGVTHLDGRRQALGPLGQHPGEILPRVLPSREEHHDPLPLVRSRHDAGGEQSRALAGVRGGFFPLRKERVKKYVLRSGEWR
jgi:hypothetical protein